MRETRTAYWLVSSCGGREPSDGAFPMYTANLIRKEKLNKPRTLRRDTCQAKKSRKNSARTELQRATRPVTIPTGVIDKEMEYESLSL